MPDDAITIERETIKTDVLYRDGEIVGLSTRADDDEDKREFDLVFSSEAPVSRWWGTEVLDHKRASVNLDIVKSGRAPFLADHDARQHIGVITTASVKEKEGRATVRFAQTQRADEVRSMVLDGIRPNVSVGYRIDKLVLESEGTDESEPVYRAVAWTPLEISSVPLGADMAAQIARAATPGEGQFETVVERRQVSEAKPMPDDVIDKPKPAPAAPVVSEEDRKKAIQSARDTETARVREIQALGERHSMRELAEKLITDGTEIAVARGTFLEKIGERGSEKPLHQSPADLDLTKKELKRYNLPRAILAAHDKSWRGAEFEQECSQEIAKRLDREPEGFFVPLDWQAQRDERTQALLDAISRLQGQRVLDTATATGAAELVATDHLGASFIELLRNMQVVRALGATVLSGLRGDVTIPKQTGAGTAAWVAEGAAPAEGALTTGQIALAPKTLTGFQEYSRKLLLQSDPSIDALVRSDLAQVIAIEFDRAAINGSGTGAEPEGILNTSGIGIAALGTDGAVPTWDAVVELETDVAVANALMNRLAYLGNAKVRGKLKTTPKVANQPIYLMSEGGEVNGYNSMFSQQVPDNLTKGTGTDLSALIFGNWADLILAEWGVMDMIVNPYSKDTQRVIRVSASMEGDVDVRRAESFSAIVDMVTI